MSFHCAAQLCYLVFTLHFKAYLKTLRATETTTMELIVFIWPDFSAELNEICTKLDLIGSKPEVKTVM